jgi:hypothetical protein
MKNTKISQKQKSYLNLPAENTEHEALNQDQNNNESDLKESTNNAFYSMSPRQYWAGPHFFFHTFLPKKNKH